MKRILRKGSRYVREELIELFRQYSAQIRRDKALRRAVQKKLEKFAPYKPGDKVYYKEKWKDSPQSKPNKPGIVVSCDYIEHEQFNRGVWQVKVRPATKAFVERRSYWGHEFLPLAHVRLAKE